MTFSVLFTIAGILVAVSCFGGMYALAGILRAMKHDAPKTWEAYERPWIEFSTKPLEKNHLPTSVIIECYRWLFTTPSWAVENSLTRRWFSQLRWFALLNLIAGLGVVTLFFKTGVF